jgi:DNA replication protein DnaC
MALAPPGADAQPGPENGHGPEEGASSRPRTCADCGRPLEAVTVELPLGLGPRTFAEPCACEAVRRATEARERAAAAHRDRIRSLLRQSGIGRRHAGATFESFATTPASAPIVDVCRSFVAAFPQAGRGLTLSGPAGTGKTHLAVAVTRALIERGVAAVIVNVPLLLVTFRGTFRGEHPERFDQLLDLLCRCDHLTLDDLGRERTTEWVQETLYLVVNARYEECLATSITTNCSPAELRTRLGEPVLDRLVETNSAYWCQWVSHRRSA